MKSEDTTTHREGWAHLLAQKLCRFRNNEHELRNQIAFALLEERARVLNDPRLVRVVDIVREEKRHGSSCLHHLYKTYPCEHSQALMAFDEMVKEIQ